MLYAPYFIQLFLKQLINHKNKLFFVQSGLYLLIQSIGQIKSLILQDFCNTKLCVLFINMKQLNSIFC